jgi:hypothetical protein
MTIKEKAARAGTRTASDIADDKNNSTSSDPVRGWYSLGQAAKEQRQRASKNTDRYGKGAKR